MLELQCLVVRDMHSMQRGPASLVDTFHISQLYFGKSCTTGIRLAWDQGTLGLRGRKSAIRASHGG